MKKALALLAALTGALLVAAVPAQAARTNTVLHVRNGQDAFAVYTAINGGFETEAFIVASSGIVQTPPGSPQVQLVADLEVVTIDLSTGNPVSGGTGQATPTTLVFGNGLASATLVATIPMIDPVSGQPLGNAEVNLSWTGIGPVTKQTQSSHVRTPGFTVNRHMSGSSRFADVSGSILFANVEYAIVLQQAGIDVVRTGEVDIQH